MTHQIHSQTIDEDDLQRFIDGRLDEASRIALAREIERQPALALRVDALLDQAADLRLLREHVDVGDSANFCPDLQAQLARRIDGQRSVRRLTAIAAAFAMIAGAGLLTAWGAGFIGEDRDSLQAHAPQDDIPAATVTAGVSREAGRAVTPVAQRSLLFGGEPLGLGLAPPQEGEASIAWLASQLVDHTLSRPDLEALDLRLAGGTVLKTLDSPAIKLVYQDSQQHTLYLFAGLMGGAGEQAFSLVPEGYISLNWRRGPLAFALIASPDIPQLLEVVRLVSAGVGQLPDQQIATTLRPRAETPAKEGAASGGGAPLILPGTQEAVLTAKPVLPLHRPESTTPEVIDTLPGDGKSAVANEPKAL